MARIFISYRRQDTKLILGRVLDRLREKFGPNGVFVDIDAIPFGVDFRAYLESEICRADAVLVLIGHGWAEARDDSGDRRLDNPNDFVRLEIETALQKNILLGAVLIDGAPMPRPGQLPNSLQPLLSRNALPLDAIRDFDAHMARLIADLERHFVEREAACGLGQRTDAREPLQPRNADLNAINAGHKDGGAPNTPLSSRPSANLLRGSPATFGEAERLYGGEIGALWDQADFEGVVEAGDRAFNHLWEGGSKEQLVDHEVRSSLDPVFSALWKTLLARLATARWPSILIEKNALKHKVKLYGDQNQGKHGDLTPSLLHSVAIAMAWQGSRASGRGLFAENPISFERTLHGVLRKKVENSFQLRVAQLALNSQHEVDPVSFPSAIPLRLIRLLVQPVVQRLANTTAEDEIAVWDLTPIGSDASRLPRAQNFGRVSGELGLSEILSKLSEIDSMRLAFSRRFPATLPIPVTGSSHGFQGRLPELHKPISTGLRLLLKEKGNAAQLLSIVSEAAIVPYDLTALLSSRLSGRGADRFIGSFVQYLDHCGLLARSITAARNHMPTEIRLSQLTTLVDRMEQMFCMPRFQFGKGPR